MQAHKVGKLKTIPCFVKTYSTDGQFMVESLIENIHREDLSGQEKGKFAQRIMKEEGLKTETELARRVGVKQITISSWLDEVVMRKTLGPKVSVSSSVIAETKSLPEQQRIQLIKEAEREDFGSREMRKRVSEIKSGERPEPIQLERTANDVVGDIVTSMHDFKKEEGISNKNELAKRLSLHKETIYAWFDEIRVRKEFKSLGPRLNELSSSTIELICPR